MAELAQKSKQRETSECYIPAHKWGRANVQDEALLTLGTESQPATPLPQGTTPTTTTCTSPAARHPTTTTSAESFVPDYKSISQSRKIHTGHNEAGVATASAALPPPSALGSSAQQSLRRADANHAITRGQEVSDGLLASPNSPSLQSHWASTFCTVPKETIARNNTPAGCGDTAIPSRPFSARVDAIEQVRSSFSSPNQKKPSIGAAENSSRTRKRSIEPLSAATTPRPSKRAKARIIGSRRFACPFRKKNPLLYRHDQCKHGYKRISDVKQHLYRRHMTYICNRCGSEFADESKLTKHQTQEEACKVIPEESREDPGGITPRQKALLHRRGDPKTDEREQWGIMWRIVFPSYTQLEPSPYVDDSEKVDAVFQFAHTNALHIARAIPELNNVPEVAIKLFVENIRNALVSSGHVEDIPPPMDSPGFDDSPQGDAIRDAMFEVAQLASMKEQPVEEEKKMFMQSLPNLSTGGQMSGNTPDLLFNMPLDFSYLQPNADGWDDFGEECDTAAFSPPGKVLSQVAFAESTSLPEMGQISVVDYLPIAQPHGHVPSTRLGDQVDAERSECAQPGQERT